MAFEYTRFMRTVVAFAVVLFTTILIGAFVLSARKPHASADAIAGGARSELMWPAPEFEFTDQLGRSVSSKSLRGQPYIASFLFTSCRTLCPLLSAKLVMTQRKLTHPTLRFV